MRLNSMTSTNPLVTFIIPYFNDYGTISASINSVFNQTYTNWEIVLVNDGSTENESLEKLKDFSEKDKITVLHQPNLGPSVARNLAIEMARGEFIVFLDSDDLICKTTLSKVIPLFDENSEVSVIFGNCQYFGARSDIKKQYIPTNTEILIYNPIAICTILRKSILTKDIRFDPALSMLGLEDWEFWVQLFSNNIKFMFLNDILFEIRVDTNSRTFQQANKNLNKIKKYIYTKHIAFVIDNLEKSYYLNRRYRKSLDIKIGGIVLGPYRLIKSLLNKLEK